MALSGFYNEENNGVFRRNPAQNANPTLLTTAAPGDEFEGIASGPGGTLYAWGMDFDPEDQVPFLVQIDPTTGHQSTIWRGTVFDELRGYWVGGFVVESNGTIVFPASIDNQAGVFQIKPGQAPTLLTPDLSIQGLALAPALRIFQWTGEDTDNLWSNGTNWLTGQAPAAGSNLIFPGGAAQTNTQDDLGLSFHAVSVQEGNYQISGQPLTVSAGLTVQAGSLTLDNTVTVTGGNVTILGGTLTVAADGFLDDRGSLTNGGTLHVAASVNVAGGYTQAGTGTFQVDIGGSAAGQSYGQVKVGGRATLAGALQTNLVNGFTPSLGEQFTVMTFGSKTGALAVNGLPWKMAASYLSAAAPTRLVLSLEGTYYLEVASNLPYSGSTWPPPNGADVRTGLWSTVPQGVDRVASDDATGIVQYPSGAWWQVNAHTLLNGGDHTAADAELAMEGSDAGDFGPGPYAVTATATSTYYFSVFVRQPGASLEEGVPVFLDVGVQVSASGGGGVDPDGNPILGAYARASTQLIAQDPANNWDKTVEVQVTDATRVSDLSALRILTWPLRARRPTRLTLRPRNTFCFSHRGSIFYGADRPLVRGGFGGRCIVCTPLRRYAYSS